MAERFLFFNSAAGDPRMYKAQDFAEYFGSVLSSGLLHTDMNPNLVVSVEAGTMNTVVTAGDALIKGHLYENTTPLTLTHSIPEPTMDRIDRIVLRLDLKNQSRYIKLFVKEGESAVTPVAPTLQRDDFVHELSLAQIRVRKNTVQLLASDIVDERLDESLCGLVYSLISIPSDQLQNWITARIAELEIEADRGLADYLQAVAIAEDALQTALQAHEANAQGLYDNYSVQLQTKLTQFETDFNTWFQGLKDQLSTNVALSLQNQINILNDALDATDQKIGELTALNTTSKVDLVSAINELVATLMSHLADYTQFKSSKGQAGGLAELGDDGLVKTMQLPSFGKWEMIADIKANSNVAQIVFENLGLDEYRQLSIIFSVKSSGTFEDFLDMRINNDNGSSYASQSLKVSASNVTAATSSPSGALRFLNALPKSAERFNSGEMRISNYADKPKYIRTTYSSGITSTHIDNHLSLWRNEIDPITKIQLMGTIAKGSSFIVMGVR